VEVKEKKVVKNKKVSKKQVELDAAMKG